MKPPRQLSLLRKFWISRTVVCFATILFLSAMFSQTFAADALAATNASPVASERRGPIPDAAATAVRDAHLDYAPGEAPKFWSVAAAETIMARWPDYSKAYWQAWTYVNGYELYGFEMLYRATGDKKYFDYAKRYIDQFVDADGKTVWQVRGDELPGVRLKFMAGLQRLPNGNTLMANWLGHGNQSGSTADLIEVTPDKRVVWTFYGGKEIKTISSALILDESGDRADAAAALH